jgi:hypothetical protein
MVIRKAIIEVRLTLKIVLNHLNQSIMENYGVIELSSKEMISIDGGKSLSYYLGLVVGAVVGTAVALVKGIQDGVDGKHA